MPRKMRISTKVMAVGLVSGASSPPHLPSMRGTAATPAQTGMMDEYSTVEA